MPDTAIRLQLLIGTEVPVPAPQIVIDSLLDVEVQNHSDARDGFQMSFTLGRGTTARNFDLLQEAYLETNSRVILVAIIKGVPQVLIDGIITHHQMIPSPQPGASRLTVTGEDISVQMDLEQKRTTYPNQSDSSIVTQIVGQYGKYGLIPQVTSSEIQPSEKQQISAQDGTDLNYIRTLAQRNGFIFYIEPSTTPGTSVAYWGPDKREGVVQSALTMNMGPYTNVESMNFSYDALSGAEPSIKWIDTKSRQSIVALAAELLRMNLSQQPSKALRRTLPAGTAGLTADQAGLLARAAISQGSDAITCTGELDTRRYGQVLRARRLVGMRGVGESYNGNYYVKEVTHHLSRGQYRQSFTLVREGRGAKGQTVTL